MEGKTTDEEEKGRTRCGQAAQCLGNGQPAGGNRSSRKAFEHHPELFLPAKRKTSPMGKVSDN